MLRAPLTTLFAQAFNGRMDLRERGLALDMPVHLISGSHDLVCPPELARDFLSGLSAPSKHYHEFSASGHTPMWDEPERFLQLIGELIR